MHNCDRLVLTAAASSSASVLLRSGANTSAEEEAQCGPRPVLRVLILSKPHGEWQRLPQIGRHGEPLPLELVGVRCPHGCRIAINARGGFIHNATSSADGGELVFTPEPIIPPPHPPGRRLELLLHPPLPPPLAASAGAFVAGVRSLLDAPGFIVREPRLRVTDVSSTGSVLVMDALPEDIYAYVSGPEVNKLELNLALGADELNISGHTLDPRFGIWRQASPRPRRVLPWRTERAPRHPTPPP